MSRNKKHRRPQQPQPARGQQEERLSPSEFRQKMIDEDVKRLQGGGYRLIEQKTKDTAETRNFINILDRLMYRARMNASTKGCKFTNTDLDTKFLPRIEKAKEALNLVAAELAGLMGEFYRPPKGYTNPLRQKKPVQQQQQKPQPVVAPEAKAVAESPAPPAAGKEKKNAKTPKAATSTNGPAEAAEADKIVQLPVSPSAVARAAA